MTKALTLHQPYAYLIQIRAKEYETRSWGTSYRGPLVIHAGKTETTLDDLIYACRLKNTERGPFETHFIDILQNQGVKKWNELAGTWNFGCAVCVCDLVDCVYMTPEFITSLSGRERAFGLFSPGRYAWKMANVRLFQYPPPVKGQQGLWDWQGALP